MLNGEGNFDQEFVQKTAEELQKMVDEGVFASDSVALTDDEAQRNSVREERLCGIAETGR